jgi:hypothetical protein
MMATVGTISRFPVENFRFSAVSVRTTADVEIHHRVDVGGLQIGPLVERPDRLGGIHRAAATQRHEEIGGESARQFGAAHHRLNAGLGLYFCKDGDFIASVRQLLMHHRKGGQRAQRRIGDDERPAAAQVGEMGERFLAEDDEGGAKIPHITS